VVSFLSEWMLSVFMCFSRLCSMLMVVCVLVRVWWLGVVGDVNSRVSELSLWLGILLSVMICWVRWMVLMIVNFG